MNFYIEKENQIILWDTDLQKIENTVNLMPDIPNDIEIKQTEKDILYRNDEFVFADDIQDEIFKEKKEDYIKKINEQKESAFKAGFYFNNAHFDCDDRAQIRLSAQLAIAKPEDTIIWLDYDYQPITFTYDQFVQMCAVATEFVTSIEFETSSLLEQVANAQSIEELELMTIDFNLEKNTSIEESEEVNE